jgi:hypothetical protein
MRMQEIISRIETEYPDNDLKLVENVLVGEVSYHKETVCFDIVPMAGNRFHV